MLAGQALNFFLQAGFFILLARLLGVEEYGVFAGVFALVNTITPYSALGWGVLFMRYVSRDHDKAPIYWGNALLTTAIMTLIIAGIFLFIGPSITKSHSAALMIHLVIANCLFSQIVLIAGKIFQTYERMRLTAMLTLLSNLVRFIILLVLWIAIHRATAVQWSVGVLIASALSAIIAIWMVCSAVGMPQLRPKLIWKHLWEGIGFSAGSTTQAIYNDFDKTLLSHYGMNQQNGFYTLAYRIIDFAATPVGAIDSAVLPRFFSLSHSGIRPVISLAVKSIRPAIILGFVTAIGVWVIAPVVPHMVGADFRGVLNALHWLCLIPLLRGIHTISGSALTATSNQHIRLIIQCIIAVMNLCLNIVWIPKYGWVGAAWSSVVSDGLLALLNISLLFFFWRRATNHQN